MTLRRLDGLLRFEYGSNMIQKIIQVGKSAAVTIPRDFLRKHGLRTGDRVIVEADDSGELRVRKGGTRRPLAVDAEFLFLAKEILQRYRPTLEKLAQS